MYTDADRELFLHSAAVAFADGCTLPLLTPTCPFYEVIEDRPFCDEQCRAVAEEMRPSGRPIATHAVGGLLLTGREIPIQTVVGLEPFDASGLYMKQRHLDLWQQSTSALLLGLRNAMVAALLGDDGADFALVRAEWEELVKRQLPLSRVAAAGPSWEMAGAAVSRAILPILEEKRLVGSGRVLSNSGKNEWHSFLTSQYAKFQSVKFAPEAATAGEFATGWRRIPVLVPEKQNAGHTREQAFMDPVIQFCFSRGFFLKLNQWFGRAFTTELAWEHLVKVPGAPIFDGLDGGRYDDELGQWLWDRFTQTKLDDWSTNSLIWERQWLKHGKSEGMPERLLRERVLDQGEVDEAVFQRLHHPERGNVSSGFDPKDFVARAVVLLRRGESRAAADIFQGIVELRPADPEAWNNLGFCQLSFDPRVALFSLGRSAMFGEDLNKVRVANQMLALHMVGRDADARSLEALVRSRERNGDEAWLWGHERAGSCGELVSVGVDDYISSLCAHIREGRCRTSSTDEI